MNLIGLITTISLWCSFPAGYRATALEVNNCRKELWQCIDFEGYKGLNAEAEKKILKCFKQIELKN